ncbi:related to mitochondrial tricarboxylate/dicarboxylate carrier proteins [Phialocephala subalpina]|uniref:Related to mitochondrial tricarboxylate/dicarboxylate carrier proteins n=1 Tax=Phialocephala subalpina TaxID=576137 RepID=A0A1L7WMQ2_9HELO|nr:related to mitochondrial tricarboxylate/dicarboxylate carrier proteins [Phialocephala subalpina]
MAPNEKTNATTKIIAGGMAGASETIITYPAEFVKTRRQLPQHAHSTISSHSILKSTYRSSGFSGFYSGCGALATSNALKSGIRFFSFETSKDFLDKLFHTQKGQRSPWVNVLSGLSAGVTESLLVVTPGEALKTRMIEDAGPKGQRVLVGKGVLGAARLVVRENGVSGLWRGAMPVMSKQATNSAVRFTAFGAMQEQVAKRWPAWDGQVITTLVMGAISGVVTVCVALLVKRPFADFDARYASMPFDNIKTRIQGSTNQYSGMLDCTKKSLASEGVGVFWRGTTPRLVRLTLSSGITFTVYDQVVRLVKGFQRPLTEIHFA